MSRFAKLELPDVPGAARADEPAARRSPFELAERCLREGAYEPALRYYSRALADDSRNERAWLGQVLCLVHLGEYREAIAWTERALAVCPQSAELVAAKALAWGRAGDLDKALAFSDASLKMAASSAFVWWARGDALAAHNTQTARFCFDKAAELAGDDWQLPFWIARTYLSIGQAADARRLLQSAEQRDPDNPIVWHHLGVACRELGMLDEARRAFEHALRLNPALDEAREALEQLARKGGLLTALKGLFARR